MERLKSEIKELESLNQAIDRYHIQRCDAASDLTMALRALETIGAIKLPTEHPEAQAEQSA